MSKFPKVKAMGLFTSNGRFLGTQHVDRVKGEDFVRLIGGHVEFGERAEDAMRREVMEEVGVEIEQLRLLDILENIFTHEGSPGHEVIFIYHALFADRSLYSRDTILISDSGGPQTAVWVPAGDVFSGAVRLYPVADYARLLKEVTEQTP